MSEMPRRSSCVFHADGKFLFSAADSTRGEFLIPVGGAVETDESPESAVVREVWEEIGVEIEAPIFVGVLEDVFDYDGEIRDGTVICFLAEAESIEGLPETAREEDGEEAPLQWLTMEQLCEGSRPAFPKGLLEILDGFGLYGSGDEFRHFFG